MNRAFWRWSFACLLAMSTLVGIATPARADISFSVTPALNDLLATPGASGEQMITLTNDGSDPLDISIVVENATTASPERSAVAWLSLDETELHVEPGEQHDVKIGIDVPKETPSGGYYAKVTFTTGSADAADNSAAISGQLSVGMLLTIDGEEEIVREAEIARLAPVLDGDGRVSFQMVVENAGNVHVIPGKADVEVRNADGSPLGKLDFDSSVPILPGNSATLMTHGSLPLTIDGNYQAAATFAYGDKTVSATLDFSVSPSLTIAAITVCENLDRGPTFGIDLNNDGGLALQPMITMSLEGGDGSSLGKQRFPPAPHFGRKPARISRSTFRSVSLAARIFSSLRCYSIPCNLPSARKRRFRSAGSKAIPRPSAQPSSPPRPRDRMIPRDSSPHRFRLPYIAAIAFTFLLVAMPGNAGADHRLQSSDYAMEATPIDPVVEEDEAGDFTTADEATTSLSLTIESNDLVDFGAVEPGQTVTLSEAVTVSVIGAAGAWQLTCSGEEGRGHTTSAGVGDLAFADTGTEVWTAFEGEPAPCFEQAGGDATVIYDYELAVPDDATPGDFQVVVTYAVEALP